MSSIRSTPIGRALSLVFKLQPGDGLPLLILLAHSFLKGVSRVFFETPVNTIFLSRFSVQELPLVYVATAVVATLFGLAYVWFEERSNARNLLTATLIGLALATGIFYIALLTSSSRVLPLVAMVWKDVNWTLYSVEFWALAGLLMNVRQGKRLFGLVAGGEIIASCLSGFSVPFFVRLSGTVGLLLISCVATALNAIFLIYTFYLFRDRLTSIEEEDDDDATPVPLLRMVKDNYLRLFFIISVLSFFAEYFIEYAFYGGVETTLKSEARMASFFGVFYGILGASQLVTGTFVAGPLLVRYGLTFGLMLLPVANATTTGFAALAGTIPHLLPIFFAALVIAKLLDETIRHTIEMPVYTILYQPLPRSSRLRAQAVRESMVEPVAIGLCGVLLYLFSNVLALSVTGVLYVTFGVAVLWAASSYFLRREYTVRLTQALSARRLGGEDLSLQDPTVQHVLETGLSSSKAGQAIYSIDMLQQAGHSFSAEQLRELLRHPEAAVRERTLILIENSKAVYALESLLDRLRHEESPAIYGRIIRARCALQEGDCIEETLAFLKAPEPLVRKGALVGLLRYCGLEGALAAGPALQEMLSSENSADRSLGAEVIGEIGIASYYRPLLPMLSDMSIDVRRAAIQACGELRCKQALARLIDLLTVSNIRSAVLRSVAKFGDEAVSMLAQTCGDPFRPSKMKLASARLLGRIGSRSAAEALTGLLDSADCMLRTEALVALSRCPASTRAIDHKTVNNLIRREVRECTWVLAAWTDLSNPSQHGVLQRALLNEVDERRKRVFLLLSLAHPPRVIDQVRTNLALESSDKRSMAIETLDNLLSMDLKLMLLPILDDIENKDRLQRLRSHFPEKQLSFSERLDEIISERAGVLLPWTRASALYEAASQSSTQWSTAMEDAVSDGNPLVKETATWAKIAPRHARPEAAV